MSCRLATEFNLKRVFKKIRSRLAGYYELLKRGHALRFGHITLVRSLHFANLVNRLKQAELELARHDTTAPSSSRPLPVPKNLAPKRSVAFINNSYYNFFYLSGALRRRGWDALSVNLHSPSHPDSKYFHGHDLDLFDPVPEIFEKNLSEFHEETIQRFRLLHFYGRGAMSISPALYDRDMVFDSIPSDFLRLRQVGVKIGYSVSGCLDGVAQSSVHKWSGGACDRCVWQKNPRMCNDLGNLAWGHKVQMFADLVATEGFPALDWQGAGDKLVREPLTTALDPDFWRPDIEVPEKYRLRRAPGELIVYHGVGNYDTRGRNGRNIKGTGAVLAAIDKLRGEGMPVRLEFVTDVPSKDVRFIQVQADVIVDQLNHGRYGAQAREGLMLGRPTVCHINKSEPAGADRLQSIDTCPLVSANEDTIYAVLRDLLLDPSRRQAIGQASRAFAMKWHAADACAERFEVVYDRIMAGLPPVAKANR